MKSAMNDSDAIEPVEPATGGAGDERSAATHLARNLGGLRHARQLTQEGLARAAAVPRSTIANLESGAGNPSQSLAKILEEKGDPTQAAKVLDALVKTDENNLEALKAIARIRSALGERQKALDALQASFFISPFDYKLHTQAGEFSLEAKDYAKALTEFQVAVALAPPNIAEANYNVAAAFHALGREPEAKRAVLRALEAAPRYEKAQELLLRIVGQ